jgi:hypothetical protein
MSNQAAERIEQGMGKAPHAVPEGIHAAVREAWGPRTAGSAGPAGKGAVEGGGQHADGKAPREGYGASGGLTPAETAVLAGKGAVAGGGQRADGKAPREDYGVSGGLPPTDTATPTPEQRNEQHKDAPNQLLDSHQSQLNGDKPVPNIQGEPGVKKGDAPYTKDGQAASPESLKNEFNLDWMRK